MIHRMKLYKEPFEMIKSGAKTYELRLNDEKRQQVKINDEIIFTQIITAEELTCVVLERHLFPDFTALYNNLPLIKCGYTESTIKTASPLDMRKYYTEADEIKYGVLALEIRVKEKQENAE